MIEQQAKMMAYPLYLPEPPSTGDLTTARSERGAGERIVLVEDAVSVRAITARLLASLNFEVLAAPDAGSALALLDSLDAAGLPVDLVLSDVVMPLGMNGIDLSIAIWGRFPRTPVLLCSGYPDQVLKDAGLSDEDMQQIRLIRKPFTREALIARINNALYDVR